VCVFWFIWEEPVSETAKLRDWETGREEGCSGEREIIDSHK